MNLIIGLLLGEGDLAAELVGTAMIVLVFIAVVVVRSARARSTVIKAPSFFVGFGARARQRHRQVLERLLDPGETVIATAQAMHNSPGKDFLLGDFAHIGMKTFILGASTRRLFALE